MGEVIPLTGLGEPSNIKMPQMLGVFYIFIKKFLLIDSDYPVNRFPKYLDGSLSLVNYGTPISCINIP